jgi:acylphosphatase
VSGPERLARRFLVAGKVQGVGFRWFTRRAASDLGVAGRVCNLPDGRVEAEATGSREQLDAFRERLRQGPSGSRVSRIEEQEISPVPEWDGFVIDR